MTDSKLISLLYAAGRLNLLRASERDFAAALDVATDSRELTDRERTKGRLIARRCALQVRRQLNRS